MSFDIEKMKRAKNIYWKKEFKAFMGPENR